MEALHAFFGDFDIWQVLSSFVFLIAIIDPFGNIPITIAMQNKGIKINAAKVCIASLIILMAFLFLGEWILKLFGVQIEYFAIAGGFIIFLMALEMILDIVIFQKSAKPVRSFRWLSRCMQVLALLRLCWPSQPSIR